MLHNCCSRYLDFHINKSIEDSFGILSRRKSRFSKPTGCFGGKNRSNHRFDCFFSAGGGGGDSRTFVVPK